MNNRKLNPALLAAALLIAFAMLAAAQDYAVIVNESNSISSASKEDVSKWLLKKKTKWGDGSKVAPVDFAGDVREAFTEGVHGKSMGAIKSYWQKQVFSGKGTPPVEKKSEADVIAYVKSNSGAIGYVSAAADVSGVKVLEIK
jgi:ABC-type phosphate transport system substrate-binding protein